MQLSDALAAAYNLLDNFPKQYRGPFGSVYDDLSPQVAVVAANVAGSGTVFATSIAPIVASTLVVIADNAAATGTVTDAINGVFTVTPQPVSNLLVTYQYQDFTDAMLTTIINDAVGRFLVYSDITQVPAGHFAAFFHYLKGEGFTQLSSRYARQVNVTVGVRQEQRAAISANYRALAVEEFKLGDTARDDFYKRAGQREAPTEAIVTHPVRIYTPRR
jgi:hypothetical protein